MPKFQGFIKLLQMIHRLIQNFQKLELSKMQQAGGFLGRLLISLQKAFLTLIQNLLKALTKSVLIPLVLTAAESAADAGIHKNLRIGYNNIWMKKRGIELHNETS